MLYSNRNVRSPQDGAELFRDFLGEVDREHFLVMCLNTKNEPTHLNVCHIGSLNASIVHPREVLKPAILSNAASSREPGTETILKIGYKLSLQSLRRLVSFLCVLHECNLVIITISPIILEITCFFFCLIKSALLE